MERSSIKTIIIIVLLVLNLFLVGNLIFRGAYNENLEADELSDLAGILNKSDVTLGDGALPAEVVRSNLLETRRDEKKEEQVASCLLGTCVKEEFGGGMVEYLSDSGSAIFRRGFEFEITFKKDGVYGMSSEITSKTLASHLKAAGFDLGGDMEPVDSEDGFSFKITQYVSKLPIENVGITAVVRPDDTVVLSGKWLFSYGVADERALSMSVASLVLPFVSGLKSEGVELSRINGSGYGFYLEQSSTGGFELVPACTFDTDKGRFTVNALRFSILERAKTDTAETYRETP